MSSDEIKFEFVSSGFQCPKCQGDSLYRNGQLVYNTCTCGEIPLILPKVSQEEFKEMDEALDWLYEEHGHCIGIEDERLDEIINSIKNLIRPIKKNEKENS